MDSDFTLLHFTFHNMGNVIRFLNYFDLRNATNGAEMKNEKRDVADVVISMS
jgi:hypothetical protein